MYKIFIIVAGFVSSFFLLMLEQSKILEEKTPLWNFVSVLAYSIIGTTVLFVAYKILDWIIPFDVENEIFEKQNVAAAIFKGLLLLGIAIIVSAVILAP